MWEQFATIVNSGKLITIFGLIGIDTILGIIIAIKSHTFDWKKIANFLNTKVMGMVGAYYLIGFGATIDPNVSVNWVYGSFAAIDAALLAMIVEKVKKLGLPAPP